MEHDSNILKLPVEILCQIFKSLSLEDRKSIRLTCSRFYESCNSFEILKDEVIFCNGNGGSTSVLPFLATSNRKLWNLKLNKEFVADNATLLFFANHGANIRSLNFYHCKFTSGILANIIELCEMLSSISFTFSFYQGDDVEILFADFSTLESLPIVRNHVATFELTMPHYESMTNRKFLNFFTVFPNLKQLILKIDDLPNTFNEFSTDPSEVMSETKFTFSSIHNYLLVHGNRLERLKLHFPFSNIVPNELNETFNVLKNGKKLRELRMEWGSQFEDMHLVLCLKHLTFLQCDFVHLDLPSVDSFLAQLFYSIPNLLGLKLFVISEVVINFEAFKALVSSKLKTLNFSETTLIWDVEPEAMEYFPTNHTLKSLTIKYDDIQSDFMMAFCTYFLALEHLELRNLCNAVLQNIFQYQKNLRSLILNGCEFCSHYGFTGVDPSGRFVPSNFSFRNLQELEYLEFRAIEDEWQATNKMLDSFFFPKLKYLAVRIKEPNPYCEGQSHFDEANRDSFVVAILKAIQKLSQLEAISFAYDGVVLSFNDCSDLCQALPNLRYIHIVGDMKNTRFRDEVYRGLFDVRPSLRVVVHEECGCVVKYFYDVTSKTVKKQESDDKYFLSLPKVGSFKIKWMTY